MRCTPVLTRSCNAQIKKAGCTVLLVQKSILRDAYNDLSIHFLAKVVTCTESVDLDERASLLLRL